MKTAAQKLYEITTHDCKLPLHVTPNGVSHQPANDIPQLFWPDGTVCWLANMYLLSGYRKGRSRKNKGGTLLTWAKNLSPLIRWCFQNKIDFVELTDSHFRMFVNVLKMERDGVLSTDKKRGEQQVSTICATVLNFLAFLDEKMPGLNLLGPSGRINAEQKSYQVASGRGGKVITRTTWVHECVPKQRRPRRRQPISTSAVNRLYEVNASVEASAFVTRRRFVMLRLLEITGGRRIEVSFVEVKDLEEATRTGELKVFTAKQSRDAFRYVPVAQADLKELLSFVKHYRHRIIRNTLGTQQDHGRLFISETTGKPLETDTLGSELYILRRAAGIDDEEACMHAFRHRYTTNIFRDLIRTHRYQNPDDLRRALLSTETLKAKVMEWTGHSSLEMLDHYIHLAFEAESNFQETLDLLKAQKVVQSVQLMLKDYGTQLRAPNPAPITLVALAEVLEAASSELQQLLGTSNA